MAIGTIQTRRRIDLFLRCAAVGQMLPDEDVEWPFMATLGLTVAQAAETNSHGRWSGHPHP